MEFYLLSKIADEREVYITGNFNQWNPIDPKFKMTRKDDKHFYIDIDDDLLPDEIQYKFTKGSWANVELDADDNISLNRKVEKKKKITEDFVEKWRLNWGPFKEEYFPIVEIISEEFYIPQLDRHRKIWAILPYDYYSSDKSYPVLYLQDAQNLFNEGSVFGNWEIDKKLAVLAEYGRGDVIVIAIDHGRETRIHEYVFDNDQVSKGSEGKRYIRFITDTLKPYIDLHFRTKRERQFTGIGGSSLGGLISIYSGFLYPEVYSKLLIFSPSLWVEPNNNFPIVNFKNPFKIKVYLYGGGQEGSQMVKRIHHFEHNLEKWKTEKLFDFEVKTSINPDGTHNEFFWSQEFPRAIEWLYYDNPENPLEVSPSQQLRWEVDGNK